MVLYACDNQMTKITSMRKCVLVLVRLIMLLLFLYIQIFHLDWGDIDLFFGV